jgi:ParB family chromosome partitioning protein
MVDRTLVYSSGWNGSSLLAIPPSNPAFGFETSEAKATLARSEAADGLDRSWTSGATLEERFDAFRALPEASRATWLGHMIAGTLEASAGGAGERACPFHDHLGRLLGIDVAGWWRPTGANFFDRVPKAVTLAALEEIGGPAFAARYAKEKKAPLCEAAQRICAGEIIAEAELKARALAWLPEAMRFGPGTGQEAEEETPPWEDHPRSSDEGVKTGSEADEPEANADELSEMDEAA